MENKLDINNHTLSEKTIKKMLKIAKETRKNAFPCRSMHKIGASVLTSDGSIIGGCNIESMISGLGTCAERCAIDNCIANGKYDIIAVCTVDSKFTPTCGACLQYILLFSQIFEKEIWIINGDIRGHYKIKTLSELLPEGYKTGSNLQAIKNHIKKNTSKKNKKNT